jgi:hypothetical protein
MSTDSLENMQKSFGGEIEDGIVKAARLNPDSYEPLA